MHVIFINCSIESRIETMLTKIMHEMVAQTVLIELILDNQKTSPPSVPEESPTIVNFDKDFIEYFPIESNEKMEECEIKISNDPQFKNQLV